MDLKKISIASLSNLRIYKQSKIFLSIADYHSLMAPELISIYSIPLLFFIFLTCAGFLVCTVNVKPAIGFGVELFSKDEQIFGFPYDVWVGKYWNWDYSVPIDSETNTFAGLTEGGCFLHIEKSVAMLLDTAAGGSWNQKCSVPSGTGFLIPLWTGECDRSSKGYETASFQELSKCARGFDLGKVSGEVKVDNIPVAKLSAVDYSSNTLNNVTEIYTREFNVTIPSNSHMSFEKPGTFPAVAHGWFVFLKPLPPGDHSIYYQNSVEPTTLSGAGTVNTAQITYHVRVE